MIDDIYVLESACNNIMDKNIDELVYIDVVLYFAHKTLLELYKQKMPLFQLQRVSKVYSNLYNYRQAVMNANNASSTWLANLAVKKIVLNPDITPLTKNKTSYISSDSNIDERKNQIDGHESNLVNTFQLAEIPYLKTENEQTRRRLNMLNLII